MLKNPTADKLRDMYLYVMAEDYLNPEPGVQELSFEDRFALMVEKQWYAKKSAKTKRLQAKAGFRQAACLEDIEYSSERNLSRKEVTLLGSCLYIQQRINVIISGKTGTGKSYLGCALGNAACRQGYSSLYYRVPDILTELAVARLDQKYLRLLDSLRKVKLLILDDIGLSSFSHDEARDLLEIAELRYNRTSTIFISQIPHEKWYELFEDPTLADAFMDRVVHNSFILPLDSSVSMREVMAQKKLRVLDLMQD